jgi:hypothetical protein
LKRNSSRQVDAMMPIQTTGPELRFIPTGSPGH